jgi:hypothetical protein
MQIILIYKMKNHIILIGLLLVLAHSAKVFDIANSFKNFTCMKALGY